MAPRCSAALIEDALRNEVVGLGQITSDSPGPTIHECVHEEARCGPVPTRQRVGTSGGQERAGAAMLVAWREVASDSPPTLTAADRVRAGPPGVGGPLNAVAVSGDSP